MVLFCQPCTIPHAHAFLVCVCVWCLFGTHFFAHPHSLSSIARIRVLVILWFVLCCLCTSLVCFSFPLPFLSLLPRKNGVLLSFPFFSFFFSAIGNGGWGEVWEKREKAFLFFFEEQKKREEIGEKKGKTNKIPRKLFCTWTIAGRSIKKIS